MRLAALILGIISSLLGLLFGIAFITSINALTTLDKNYKIVSEIDNPTVNLLSWVMVGCFVVGLISACLIMTYPRLSGKVIIAVSIIGFLFGVGTIYAQIMNGMLFLAGVFALVGSKEISKIPPDEQDTSSDKSESILGTWLKAGKKNR